MLASDLTADQVEFTPNLFEENYKQLLMWAYIASDTNDNVQEIESEVAKYIRSFTVISKCGEIQVTVEDGQYSTALLLFYLARMHGKDDFYLNEDDVCVVRNFFSTEVRQHGSANSRVSSAIVQALLADGGVHVRIVRN